MQAVVRRESGHYPPNLCRRRIPMRYMILIASDEAAEAKANQAEQEQVFGAYMKYTEDLKKAGVLIAVQLLPPFVERKSDPY